MSTLQQPAAELFFRQGDKAAFESLFRSFYSRLVGYAVRVLGDQDEAEEIVQQVFVGLWESRSNMSEPASVQSYLFRSVYNRCMNVVEKEKVKNRHREEVIANGNVSVQPGEELHHAELKREMKKAMDKLPEQCRRVFELSRNEGLKYAAIAEVLNISVKTVENHMGKALKILREELKDYLVVLLILMVMQN